MKIAVINGSPKGRESVTQLMVSSFLQGAERAGAETVTVFLAEKDIRHCLGCMACWFKTPGECIIDDDDMADILSQSEDADVVVLATPLKYANVSSMLKVFIERLLVFANPYILVDQAGETRHPKKAPGAESSFYRAKLVAIANGGLGQRGHFQVLSHWMHRLALNNLTEVIGEIYAPQGPLLANPPDELRPVIADYLRMLEKSGTEIVTDGGISAETQALLDRDLIPEEIYLQQINCYFKMLLSSVKHPYVGSW
ncbi:MAG: flavodoxin family protein [Solidesulfovibrio sp.]|uniref:flavodoxin family protein n=1 Tax=Solidesulfovibrio sp. TaxID=2910990 RepID=UPI0031589C7A